MLCLRAFDFRVQLLQLSFGIDQHVKPILGNAVRRHRPVRQNALSAFFGKGNALRKCVVRKDEVANLCSHLLFFLLSLYGW
ncbi:hypothetical protein TNCV_3811831 [Trichonephila clavipes]|nr:hypothetical protein TNCV_3811831 [Trichonephila clavipes]